MVTNSFCLKVGRKNSPSQKGCQTQFDGVVPHLPRYAGTPLKRRIFRSAKGSKFPFSEGVDGEA